MLIKENQLTKMEEDYFRGKSKLFMEMVALEKNKSVENSGNAEEVKLFYSQLKMSHSSRRHYRREREREKINI